MASRYAFKPYQPPPIPSGSYDPALDASRRAASRGLKDTTQDTTLAGTRAGEDYGFGLQDINTSFDRGTQDLTTSRDRGMADIGTQRGYANEDYSRDTGLLTRQFGILAGQQAEGARKYGVTSGGIALLSAAKRAENQGIQQAGLDTAHNRTLAGLGTQETRLGEDFTTGSTRLGEDKTSGIGRLGVGYNRGVTDRTTSLDRAGREDTFFGLDTEGQKAFQAGQAGYSAPQRGEAGGMPSNEFVGANGKHTKVVLRNGIRYVYDQNGKIISQRRA